MYIYLYTYIRKCKILQCVLVHKPLQLFHTHSKYFLQAFARECEIFERRTRKEKKLQCVLVCEYAFSCKYSQESVCVLGTPNFTVLVFPCCLLIRALQSKHSVVKGDSWQKQRFPLDVTKERVPKHPIVCLF